ncbi:molt-inhibiting hormone-like [Macrobrachium rosenbergii]|uniref:molt-inhibiting hormone-like n=1 Tax=Macrobrachium rosenbergii TaxID=79674 RepID=UPI0034D73BE6
MVCSSLVWTTMLVTIISATTTVSNQAEALSADGDLSELEIFASSALALPSSDPQPPVALVPLGDHNAAKRGIFDMSCKGVFDRKIFVELERICDDCYNLYRKPYVSINCRRKCYRNMVFRKCILDLQMEEKLPYIARIVQMYGK